MAAIKQSGFPGYALDPSYNQLGLTATGLTATAGGGQANALALPAGTNRLTTVATAGDSVLLPTSVPGLEVIIINSGANSCNVFPQTGDQINVLGANTAFALASAKACQFNCAGAGQWNTILSA